VADTSTLRLRIFDGSRQLFSKPAKFLVRIVDGNQVQHIWQEYPHNDITFEGLPFYNNLFDNYTVVVSSDGYKQAGYQPVKLSNTYTTTLDIMLISNDPGFSFVNAHWDTAKVDYPFIASGADNATGEQRYDDLLDKTEKSLACLLNLCEAMSQIALPQGTPLDYIKQLRWDPPFAPARDRFFAWCDVGLIDQVKAAAAAGKFAVENAPGIFHPGATSSWKQIEFGEANVQLTFHENEKLVVNGVNCTMVEPDIDYYRDLAAHIILEIVPNGLTHTLTEPAEVYVLRWIAGRTAGIPEFAPLYTIT
jgi:hypothetical protein